MLQLGLYKCNAFKIIVNWKICYHYRHQHTKIGSTLCLDLNRKYDATTLIKQLNCVLIGYSNRYVDPNFCRFQQHWSFFWELNASIRVIPCWCLPLLLPHSSIPNLAMTESLMSFLIFPQCGSRQPLFSQVLTFQSSTLLPWKLRYASKSPKVQKFITLALGTTCWKKQMVLPWLDGTTYLVGKSMTIMTYKKFHVNPWLISDRSKCSMEMCTATSRSMIQHTG